MYKIMIRVARLHLLALPKKVSNNCITFTNRKKMRRYQVVTEKKITSKRYF